MIFILLLVSAVSIDCFAASMSYGVNKIKISVPSFFIITTVCTSILTLSVLLSDFLKNFISPEIFNILGFYLLIIIGIICLLQNLIKSFMKKAAGHCKNLKFKLFNVRFILSIVADEVNADFDNSKTISASESLSLAIALSIDSLASGMASGLSSSQILPLIIISLIFHAAAVLLGFLAGKRLADKASLNVSWLSGVILLMLAFLKLF